MAPAQDPNLNPNPNINTNPDPSVQNAPIDNYNPSPAGKVMGAVVVPMQTLAVANGKD